MSGQFHISRYPSFNYGFDRIDVYFIEDYALNFDVVEFARPKTLIVGNDVQTIIDDKIVTCRFIGFDSNNVTFEYEGKRFKQTLRNVAYIQMFGKLPK